MTGACMHNFVRSWLQKETLFGGCILTQEMLLSWMTSAPPQVDCSLSVSVMCPVLPKMTSSSSIVHAKCTGISKVWQWEKELMLLRMMPFWMINSHVYTADCTEIYCIQTGILSSVATLGLRLSPKCKKIWLSWTILLSFLVQLLPLQPPSYLLLGKTKHQLSISPSHLLATALQGANLVLVQCIIWTRRKFPKQLIPGVQMGSVLTSRHCLPIWSLCTIFFQAGLGRGMAKEREGMMLIWKCQYPSHLLMLLLPPRSHLTQSLVYGKVPLTASTNPCPSIAPNWSRGLSTDSSSSEMDQM